MIVKSILKSAIAVMCYAALLAATGYSASEGVISGLVKDPDGAPLKAVFVRARNMETKITVSVLSDKAGKYQIKDLPAGEYELRVNGVGYQNELRSGVKVEAGKSLSLDFPLKKGGVRWSDLSIYQGSVLLPEGKGKK